MTATLSKQKPHAETASAVAMRRVVIAEDPSQSRLDLIRLLSDEGFVVVGKADNGYQAVDIATSLRPDIVLMDALLPGMDGITAAAALTADRIGPVLIFTPPGLQATTMQRLVEAGVMGCISRPFTQENLLPAVELALARHAETSVLQREVGLMRQRFQARKSIDRAIGLLMTAHGIGKFEAQRRLYAAARDHRTSVLDVATSVINDSAAGTQIDASVEHATAVVR